MDKRRGIVHRLGFLGACAIGIWLLIRVIQSNVSLLGEFAQHGPDWKFAAGAIICYLLAQAITIVRWGLLARAAGAPLGLRQVFSIGLATEAGNLVMPGANGGDAIKLGMIVRSGFPVTKLVASTATDRLAGVLGLIMVGLLAGAIQWPTAGRSVRLITAILALLATCLIAAAALSLHRRSLAALNALARRWTSLEPVVGQVAAVVAEYRAKTMWLLVAVVISMVSQTCTLMALYCSAAALSGPTQASLVATLIGGPIVVASTALPLPFGAIGVAEELGEQLFATLGVGGGGIMMLGYRCAHACAVVVLGCLYSLMRFWLSPSRAVH